MRIEVVKERGLLDKERYEFIVRVDSLALRISLTGYRHEVRESTRHRTWVALSAWYESERRMKDLPLGVRMAKQPSVPYWVQRQMLLNLEKAHAFNYTIDTGMTVGDTNGIRN